LLRQGLYYFAAMATWPEERSARRFALHLSLQPFCSQVFAIVWSPQLRRTDQGIYHQV